MVPFLCIFTSIQCCHCFILAFSPHLCDRSVVVSHCTFNLHSLWHVLLSIFPCTHLLSVTSISSSVKCLLMSFVYFLIGYFGFFTLEFWEFFISRNMLFVRHVVCKCFSVICLFILLTESFTKQQFLTLRMSNSSVQYVLLVSSLRLFASPKDCIFSYKLWRCVFYM